MFNLCTYSAASASSCQVYPSEYAYHKDSVYRTESASANCRNYPSGLQDLVWSENYIHCNGTQLRLTDSDIGSGQYTTSDYYLWLNETRNHHDQLLFIFATRVNLTAITLHYHHSSVRGLPRLRFWAVPDDFDVWDALYSSYNYTEVAAVLPSGESAGQRSVSIHYAIAVNTKKILLFRFSSSFSFALSEVEFFNCTGKSC